MRQYEHLQCGPDRLRVGPWRSDPDVGELAALVSNRPPRPESIAAGIEALSKLGYRHIVTNALSTGEQAGYLANGFEVQERLHLLGHDLRHIPEPPSAHRLRRGRRRDRPRILAVDATAFDPFWRLDDVGLLDAIGATPSSRVRVGGGPPLVGYAVTGRAGDRGYLQRLAVHPDEQGRGLGTSLVVDALSWLRRRRCHVAMVNTQEINTDAYALYRGLGFTDRPEGLAVLRLDLDIAT
jgi:ribosomal protein S18 acetylase RimI-like enzyme